MAATMPLITCVASSGSEVAHAVRGGCSAFFVRRIAVAVGFGRFCVASWRTCPQCGHTLCDLKRLSALLERFCIAVRRGVFGITEWPGFSC